MMSFCLLLLEWRQFSEGQIIFLQITSGISGAVGGVLGGVLGDYFGGNNPRGRIWVAIVSKIGSIVFFALYVLSKTFAMALVFANLVHVWASWTRASTIRPICADLARNPSERAQIVAFWILLEKTSASIFGAPLVGYLTRNMLDKHKESSVEPSIKANALAFNLAVLASFFWTMCIINWLFMLKTLKHSGMGIGAEKRSESNL